MTIILNLSDFGARHYGIYAGLAKDACESGSAEERQTTMEMTYGLRWRRWRRWAWSRQLDTVYLISSNVESFFSFFIRNRNRWLYFSAWEEFNKIIFYTYLALLWSSRWSFCFLQQSRWFHANRVNLKFKYFYLKLLRTSNPKICLNPFDLRPDSLQFSHLEIFRGASRSDSVVMIHCSREEEQDVR